MKREPIQSFDRMKETRIFLVLAFITAVVITFITVRLPADVDSRASKSSSEEADRIAIERLHQEDVEATLSDKADELAKLWDGEAVRIQPGRPAEVGKAEIYANDKRWESKADRAKTICYKSELRTSKSSAIGHLNGVICLIRTPAIRSRCEAKC